MSVLECTNVEHTHESNELHHCTRIEYVEDVLEKQTVGSMVPLQKARKLVKFEAEFDLTKVAIIITHSSLALVFDRVRTLLNPRSSNRRNTICGGGFTVVIARAPELEFKIAKINMHIFKDIMSGFEWRIDFR